MGQEELGRYVSGAWPMVYATVDGSLQIGPPLSTDVTLNYYASVPVPANDVDTDVYLTRFPDIILDACLAQAGKFNMDAELETRSTQSWRAQLTEANRAAQRARLGSRSRAVRPYIATQGAPST